MSEFNEPAYPVHVVTTNDGNAMIINVQRGLTIRQEFVKAAMQGILAHYGYDRAEDTVAEAATDYADAVLKRERETR